MFQDSHLVVTWCIHDMAGNIAPSTIAGTGNRYRIMTSFLKSSFVWQFAGGFVLGAIGLVALQPAEATQELVSRFAPTHQAR
jgi:hypothetical protein